VFRVYPELTIRKVGRGRSAASGSSAGRLAPREEKPREIKDLGRAPALAGRGMSIAEPPAGRAPLMRGSVTNLETNQ